MAFRDAVFVKGVIGSEGLPGPNRPTVAFFGRSNVGKSSVINALLGRKGLARSSSQPGRTTEINYYLVDDTWYLADLPGYGYARLSKERREKLRRHILWYAGSGEVDLGLAVLVVDIVVGMTDADRDALGVLLGSGRPVVILANKSDKGKRNGNMSRIFSIRKEFADIPVIRYSARTGEGREELSEAVGTAIGIR